MFCIICGTENPDYARFCRKCGRLISEEVENPKREESAPPPEERTPIPAQENGHSEPSPQRSTLDQLKVEEFAEHYRHLTADELRSLNTGVGDLRPEARTALEAELRTRPEPCPSEGVSNQRLPYLWGFFQGWVSLVVGLFAAIVLLPALVSGVSLDEKSAGYAIMSPLLIASGYAFVRRKKYAVVMTYVWIGFNVLIFLVALLDGLTNKSLTPEQQGSEIGAGLAQIVIGTLFWGLCAVYYRKRRSEFASQLSSKAARQ
jgi:zinc-ribbon domain